MLLLTIDPGKDAGWARFDLSTKRLVACGLNATVFVPNISKVLIERPHPGRGKASLEDLITLAIRAGEWGGRCPVTPRYITPSQWKGSIPKERCNEIVLEKLTADELFIVNATKVAKSKKHNMLDAVGIGLFGLGRF
jgi:hypothetical protein